MTPSYRPAMSEAAMSWALRLVWAICIGVYLSIFIGGIQGGGDELLSMGRAAAFTLAAGVLGKMAIGFVGQASTPLEQGQSAAQAGPVGSLVDLMASANVPHHEATAAPE